MNEIPVVVGSPSTVADMGPQIPVGGEETEGADALREW